MAVVTPTDILSRSAILVSLSFGGVFCVVNWLLNSLVSIGVFVIGTESDLVLFLYLLLKRSEICYITKIIPFCVVIQYITKSELSIINQHEYKTNHPLWSQSHPSTAANESIHCLKWEQSLEDMGKCSEHNLIKISYYIKSKRRKTKYCKYTYQLVS